MSQKSTDCFFFFSLASFLWNDHGFDLDHFFSFLLIVIVILNLIVILIAGDDVFADLRRFRLLLDLFVAEMMMVMATTLQQPIWDSQNWKIPWFFSSFLPPFWNLFFQFDYPLFFSLSNRPAPAVTSGTWRGRAQTLDQSESNWERMFLGMIKKLISFWKMYVTCL